MIPALLSTNLSLQPPASFDINDDPFVSSTHIDTFRDSTATSESDYGTESDGDEREVEEG